MSSSGRRLGFVKAQALSAALLPSAVLRGAAAQLNG